VTPALEFLKREAIVVAGATAAGVELAVASGTPLKVALMAAVPLALAAVARSLHKPTNKENSMADLTALQQVAVDLESAVAKVAALKAEAPAQVDVDAITARLQASVTALAADQQ